MDFLRAEHPRPRHFILHLSDTHLLAGERRLYGAVDSLTNLKRLFARLEESGQQPEAIVFTGDLADRGEAGAYARLRDVVVPAAERMGARVIWAMGNHDDRAAFRQVLLNGAPEMTPVDQVHHLDGLRVITLDTSVPGYHHGELTAEQLAWLRRELHTPAPDGTILAMHHPPVPSVQDLSVLVELRNQQELAAVIAGSDVRAVIAGHLHYSTFSTFAGIPVSVASATCYAQDLVTPGTRGQDAGQSFNMVHLYEDSVVHSVVPLEQAGTVGEQVGPQETADRLAAAGVRIPDARTLASA
ncbi:phosphodiesterase [Arthrobacter sp. zg-Y40]|uniref:phosphodiesterase n=1 Tax=unclassified Arthrobacter TaxID=235627 RepID=UPI001D149F8C|nr:MULTISPECIES: phosphodiesterase [unclassified Arthrobacter]MCC3277364.1 phosphodiesterase [Arthrobacter sp. zg-Y20]MCC3280035.1 phosphodiesterase [Arthrobacter sp. zg-Y40]MDK1317524.1 phosphodiesterase [Arthrobacter sp. zg.Y20]MDK1328386.1 phosphodiesterase [Arthrobacter sp. zg-Y1143]WIB06978.1 phosphodiesterase [Arthrobacter sp. zg-Y20]